MAGKNQNEIKYVKGDLFGPVLADTDPGVIVIPHVCNDRGAWGSGFVIPLGKNFPSSRQDYLAWHDDGVPRDRKSRLSPITMVSGKFGLGETQFVNIDDKIFVANMVAQTLGGVRPLYYNHLANCMDSVANFVLQRSEAREHPARIICPAFGSERAGGNWHFIEQLVIDSWIRRNISVSVYYLDGTIREEKTISDLSIHAGSFEFDCSSWGSEESTDKTPTSLQAPPVSLKEACLFVFGGVSAISPELFDKALQRLSAMCNRTLDEAFKTEVFETLKEMPCQLD